MLKRTLNLKFALLLVFGMLVITTSYFVFVENLSKAKNLERGDATELAFYKNENLHLSFQYPKSFFILEEKRYGRSVVALTPLASTNKLSQSSVGIAKTFVLEFYPNENTDSKSFLRTRASNNMAFREESVIIDGIPSIHQYYNNAYSGDQNEIWLIPCTKDNAGVFWIEFMDSPLAEQYRSVVKSLKICK